jgi:hypothetical protein
LFCAITTARTCLQSGGIHKNARDAGLRAALTGTDHCHTCAEMGLYAHHTNNTVMMDLYMTYVSNLLIS